MTIDAINAAIAAAQEADDYVAVTTVAGTIPDDADSGRIFEPADDNGIVMVHWDSGVSTPTHVDSIELA